MVAFLELLFCHLLGDYVLQTGYIAETKGQNWWHLVVHCLLYIIPFYLCRSVSWHLGVMCIAHLVIDAVKARYKIINYSCDQILHIALLLLYFI